MEDKLDLLDLKIPLMERYNRYLKWDSQNSIVAIQIISQNLGISEANVEVYFDLGKLDDEEFDIIDNCKIPIDHLFLIIKEDKERRIELYNNYITIINGTNEPVKAIRNYIDGDNEPLFKQLLQNVSYGAYRSISSYLKQTNTVKGTITTGFRSCLYQVSNKVENGDEISDGQTDWIVKAISYAESQGLNVFSNDLLKSDFIDDYEIFQKIIGEIKKVK